MIMGASSSQVPAVSPQPAALPDADGLDRRARFRALFDSEFSYVWLSLRRLGVHERELEDLAQEVFVRVYRRLDDYDPSLPIRPWLFAFAVRCASDWKRLARNRLELMSTEAESESPDRRADEQLALEEDLALLLRALENMNIDRRAVLILYELDQVRMKEVAASLGIPLQTGYSRLRVAREELTAALKRLRAQESEP
jgi:RNA polymerase sigma-70 factor (ECF subfamily)